MKNTKHTPAFCKFGSYTVSALGNVYSNTQWRSHTARPMSQRTDTDGYKYVRLTVNGKREKFRVHHLVCVLFNGPKPTVKHEVCHVNGNKLDNSRFNLRWVREKITPPTVKSMGERHAD